MNRFPFFMVTLKAITTLIMWIINKIIMVIHLCLPLWVFMLLMQLRAKNNKTTALGAFTNDNSEFQFVFPNYILIANEPNSLKTGFNKKLKNINNFFEKWKWILIIGMVGISMCMCLAIIAYKLFS